MTAREWVLCCCEAIGKKVKILEYDYKNDGRNVRDFFPFFDYGNVLDVSKIKELIPEETNFIVGLKNTLRWFSEVSDTIKFKDNVTANEIEILKNFE